MSLFNAVDVHSSKFNVVIFSSHATYPVHFIAKPLSLVCNVFVVVPEYISFDSADHFPCYSQLAKDKRITLLDYSDKMPHSIDVTLVLVSQFHFYTKAEYLFVQSLIRYSVSIGVVFHEWPEKFIARIFRELKLLFRFPRLMLRASSFGYEYLPSTRQFFPFGRKYHIGTGPHPHFLHQESAVCLLFSPWALHDQRPIKLNFLGTPTPPRRAAILSLITRFLNQLALSHFKVIEHLSDLPNDHCPCALMRYGQSELACSHLSPTQYIEVLSLSDFTLCLPGHGPWSCRSIESLLRGSIPILSRYESDNFVDLPLVHGINCLLVEDDQWIHAIDYALSLDFIELRKMRNSVFDLVGSFGLLSWPQKTLDKLGLNIAC